MYNPDNNNNVSAGRRNPASELQLCRTGRHLLAAESMIRVAFVVPSEESGPSSASE